MSPALAQAGERRDWAVLALLGFWHRAEPWHCPFGDRVKSQSPSPLQLTGETSSCTGCWLLPRVFSPSFPSLWHWGSSFPSLAISHLSCCPAWSVPWDSCAQVSSAEHRSPHPGLWKNPLNYKISQDFQGVGKPSAPSSEMALASSSSCRASDGFQRNNPFFRANAWKCIWKAMSGSFSVKSVRLNRSDGKCWCGQECLHPEGSGHWAVSHRN